MNPFTVCIFAVAAACVITSVRYLRPELALLAAATSGVVILICILQGLEPFIGFIRDAAAESGAESYFSIMLKALAISVCCRMSAEICRDCGESSLAYKVELAGKVGIVLISLPVIQQLLDIAKDLLQ